MRSSSNVEEMVKHPIKGVLLAVLLIGSSCISANVPSKVTIDGTFSGISNGSHDITVSIKGTSYSEKVRTNVVDGVLSLDVGSTTPLNSSLFKQTNPMFNINVPGVGSVDLPIRSVPFSLVSSDTEKIQGVSISTVAPASGQVLKYNGSTWAPASDQTGTIIGAVVTPSYTGNITVNGTLTASTFVGNLTGNLTGTASNATKISGYTVTTTAPSNGQVLKYNGSAWAPAADITGVLTGVVTTNYTGNVAVVGTLTASNFVGALNGTASNSSKISGQTVATTAPSNGQVLKFNGTAWAPASDNIGSAPGNQFVTNNYTGSVTVSGLITAQKFKGDGSDLSVGTANIASKLVANSLTDAEVKNGAAIAFSKLNITKANIDGLNVAAASASTANYATTAATATNAIKIGGVTLNVTGLTNGKILKYSNGSLVATADLLGSAPGTNFVTNNYTGAVTISGLMTAQKFKGDGSDLIVGTANIASKLVANSLTDTEVKNGAAIAFSKLNITKANIDGLNVAAASASTANYATTAATATNAIKIGGVTLNVTGLTNGKILKYSNGSLVATADLMGSAPGTNFVTNNYTGAVTISGLMTAQKFKGDGSDLIVGTANIASKLVANSLTDAEVKNGAAIAFSKLNITKANIDGLNVAAASASTANYATTANYAATAATATNAIKIGGVTLNVTGLTNGKILKYSNGSLVATADLMGSAPGTNFVTNNYTGAVTITGVMTAQKFIGDGSMLAVSTANYAATANYATSASSATNAIKIGGVTVNTTGIVSGQYLKYDGASFVSSNISLTGVVTNNFFQPIVLNSLLTVKGTNTASGNIIADNIRVAGRVTTNALDITGGSDLAERFDIKPSTQLKPGMVVSIDPMNPGKLILSNQAYDTKVAGVISGANGVNPGLIMKQSNSIADGEHPVALAGRVWVWCDATSTQINVGDMLTTSSKLGSAMKASDPVKSRGAILGKAMTSLSSGEGFVLVLISLQ